MDKKRGRKKKEENIQIVIEEKIPKKRGRKPKGGKLIIKHIEDLQNAPAITNVILHLKCSISDLNASQTIIDPMVYNPSIPPHILSYAENQSFCNYDNTQHDNLAYNETQSEPSHISDDECNIKEINKKLKKLKINLYKNAVDKKSACFWCTHDYDNTACYIPKYEKDNQIYGYGSFCRPECAVAFLMKEHIDDSCKFERYHLLNQIYSKVYNYQKNIKPAPNPYFLLEKFYGNLSIQEYRKLLKTEHMMLVIDKPMTRILPELHEDNDDFILNIYGNKAQTNTSGIYKVKRQSEKVAGPTKTSIMRDKFGF